MFEELINEVERLGLSFDEFLALYKVYSETYNSRKIYYNSDGLDAYTDLERKGYIKISTEEGKGYEFDLRQAGKVLMDDFLNKETPVIQETTTDKKAINNHDKFDEFWENFPTNDQHGIFRQSRFLRSGKEACKKKYFALLDSGVNHDDIIKALKYETKMRKDSNNRTNMMTYMKNSLTWINQKEYEVILESMKDNDSTSDNDWTSNAI